MYILALETAIDSVSVAVLKNQDVVAHDCQVMARGQGEALIPMIQKVITQSGLSMSDIGKVAVSVGPGSFTGVRIGLATARGIGLALNIPVLGVSTLESMAHHQLGKVMSAIDTKRGDFYTQIFQEGTPVEEPNIRTLEQIKSLSVKVIAGGNLSAFEGIANRVENPPDCLAIQVGLCAMEHGREPEPIYLREADVSC